MSIKETINKDFKEALRAKDETRLSVFRMLKTAIKNQEVHLRHPLDETEVMTVIAAQIKQRQDSIQLFMRGARMDLVGREQRELEVLNSYRPPQLTRDQIVAAVGRLAAETGASGLKDMGSLMKAFMSQYAGQADGKVVNEVVREKLTAG